MSDTPSINDEEEAGCLTCILWLTPYFCCLLVILIRAFIHDWENAATFRGGAPPPNYLVHTTSGSYTIILIGWMGAILIWILSRGLIAKECLAQRPKNIRVLLIVILLDIFAVPVTYVFAAFVELLGMDWGSGG